MSFEDFDYFCVRAGQERKRAASTLDPKVRAIHLEFAARYDHTVESMHRQAIDDSREAIERSLALLKATSGLVTT